MAAIPTRGLKIYISRNDSGPAPSPVPIAVTAVAASNPAVLTASAADVAQLYDGVELTVTNSTLAKLNGIWPITKLSTTTFSIPVDTSGDDTSAVTLDATIPGQPSNAVPFTQITNAKTPVVTMDADALAEVDNGDVIAFDNTGVGTLDNGSFVVKDKSSTGFTLSGADLSSLTAPVTSGTMLVYDMVTTEGQGAGMLEFCLASFDYSVDPGSTIDVSTTCASASLAGEPSSGTISFTGYMDNESLGFKEFMKANTDGAPRIIELVFPNNLGYILFPEVTINSFSWNVALNNAVAISGGGVANQVPVYIFN
jgi:hypothetical protein